MDKEEEGVLYASRRDEYFCERDGEKEYQDLTVMYRACIMTRDLRETSRNSCRIPRFETFSGIGSARNSSPG